ncbi:uncharacterized protein LOC132286188 [Cornus florida]|uniref:uncharacterized protein LOC132286188 n=1 Tax=Cornus florida TaxID=4283 RepID=UPI0028A04A23|nr:uncharacterized protein LOC132286188 [Cornus florida]
MNKMVITDLNPDVLKLLMILVAKSSNEAADLARAISVCEAFMNIAAYEDVLREVNFSNVTLPKRYELFQYINGLLNRCAKAGNVTAQYMLAKTVLVSAAQFFLIDIPHDNSESVAADQYIIDRASGRLVSVNHARSTFIAHFIVDQASTSDTSNRSLCHKLVRLFLCQCSPRDLIEMRPHFGQILQVLH